MKFDISDKKPKLYDVLFIGAATAAAFAALTVAGRGSYALPCEIILDIFFLYLFIRFISAFVGQIHYNPYSYNTIFYSGFALFVLSILITHIFLTVRMINRPDVYGDSMILYTLLNSAKTYMLISAPFILVFSVALCVSNISLIRHEGKRLVNYLGIILSFLLTAGEVFLFTYDYYASGSEFEVMMHDLVANTFAAVYLYFECMLIGTIIAHLTVYNYKPQYNKDYIIILGCGIRKDGTPTPLLKGRIDRAIGFACNQEELTGKKAFFITSGGRGKDEVISESASMKRYLSEHGIAEERIIEEDRSRDTYENMLFSKEKIPGDTKDKKIIFSTTNYHVFRSGICARRVKMRAVGIGAKTKWYFWPNAAVREFAGLLNAHKLKQSIIFVGLIAAYVIMTLLEYR